MDRETFDRPLQDDGFLVSVPGTIGSTSDDMKRLGELRLKMNRGHFLDPEEAAFLKKYETRPDWLEYIDRLARGPESFPDDATINRKLREELEAAQKELKWWRTNPNERPPAFREYPSGELREIKMPSIEERRREHTKTCTNPLTCDWAHHSEKTQAEKCAAGEHEEIPNAGKEWLMRGHSGGEFYFAAHVCQHCKCVFVEDYVPK